MYAIQRLPEPTPGVNVEFCARIERGNDQDKHSWGMACPDKPEGIPDLVGCSVWNSIMGATVSWASCTRWKLAATAMKMA